MRVLVTGGGGFLGSAIIQQLLFKGYQVNTLNRSSYPALQKHGVNCLQGDIRKKDDVLKAAQGCDAVIHTAAKAGVWGSYNEFYEINVKGTVNVIATCQELNIRKLVYTSSPSVVFGGEDQNNVDESAPYPKSYLAHYPKTKAAAEKLVIAAKSASLSVVSLRPHLIWGPGDNHLAPRILSRYHSGRLMHIGSATSKVDAVYIENAASAHLLALEKLSPESKINGQSYFITNHEPWRTSEIINSILGSAGLAPVTKRIPATIAVMAGTLLEFLFTFFKIKAEPPLTRFVVKQLATSHWFDQTKAEKELGYHPKVSMEEGFQRLKHYYQGNP